MDAQRYQLTRQLFVIATELVEDAHEAAIAGQSSRLNARNYLKLADRLRATAHELVALAETVAAVVKKSSKINAD